MEEIPQNCASVLLDIMEEHRATQQMVAAATGYHQTTISAVLRGYRSPSRTFILAIGRVYNLSEKMVAGMLSRQQEQKSKPKMIIHNTEVRMSIKVQREFTMVDHMFRKIAQRFIVHFSELELEVQMEVMHAVVRYINTHHRQHIFVHDREIAVDVPLDQLLSFLEASGIEVLVTLQSSELYCWKEKTYFDQNLELEHCMFCSSKLEYEEFSYEYFAYKHLSPAESWSISHVEVPAYVSHQS